MVEHAKWQARREALEEVSAQRFDVGAEIEVVWAEDNKARRLAFPEEDSDDWIEVANSTEHLRVLRGSIEVEKGTLTMKYGQVPRMTFIWNLRREQELAKEPMPPEDNRLTATLPDSTTPAQATLVPTPTEEDCKLKNRREREGTSKARSAVNFGESFGVGRSAFRGGSSRPTQSHAQSSASAPPVGHNQQQGSRFRPNQGSRAPHHQGRSGGRLRGHIQRECRSSRQGADRGTSHPSSLAAVTSSAPPPARGPPPPAGSGAARGGAWSSGGSSHFYAMSGRQSAKASPDVVTAFIDLMNKVFKPFLHSFVIMFIDDILVYSRGREDHADNLKAKLQTLHRHQLEGIKVDPQNILAMKNWPRPITPIEIRSFWGLAGYYRKFVEGFSTLASLLNKLIQKAVKFQWSDACERSFQELKSRLTTTPVLTLLEGIDEFVVNLSTTFHPQTDGQPERTIQTLENMLRACVLDFKSSWDDHLPVIEFSYNNNFYASIQMVPLEAFYGRRCRSPIGWFEIGEADLIGPDLVHQAIEKVKIIKERLKTAQSHQKFYSDIRRRDLEFKEDD
ncbi:uncharacterized protein [Nicotiana tomentosiformis]|uniref:uncharacterized protein n=1 Tax=Nicotiana tomentosiformis TaxID=4098 RepID=UPI00388C570C